MIAPLRLHLFPPARQAGYSGTVGSTDTVPLLGSQLGSWPVYGYSHRISALGGFDTASMTLRLSAAEAEDFFGYAPGCTAQIYGRNPQVPVWEGYVDRVTYSVGTLVLSRSLSEMGNNVKVTYYNDATGTTQITADVNNTDSQAIYGSKSLNLDAGIHFNADTTHKTSLRNTILALQAWPSMSVAGSADFGDGTIEIELKGFMYMALEWSIYNQTTNTGTNPPSNLFSRLTISGNATDNLAPNAPYIAETSTTINGTAGRLIEANTAFQMSRVASSGQTYLQFIQSIVEAGDAADRYVFGITPWGLYGPTRLFYYRKANKIVAYQVRALQGDGRLLDVYGRPIRPQYEIEPDYAVALMDILIGYEQAGDDPRVGYIQSVEYEGDNDAISWQTADNLTMEGVLQKNRYFRAHGSPRFGAPVRTRL